MPKKPPLLQLARDFVLAQGGCLCKHESAWRCAAAKRLSSSVTCQCPCHRRVQPNQKRSGAR